MGRRQPAEDGPPDVKPLDVDGVRTVAIVTVFWGVAFVLLALRQGALNDAGNGWWLWTCLAGVGLGLLGLEYCRKRRDAIARAALDAEAAAPDGEDDWSGVGDWSKLPDEPNDEFQYDTDDHDIPLPSATGEFPRQPSDDQLTMPYSAAGRPPGHVPGEMTAESLLVGEQSLPPAAASPVGPARSVPEPSAQPAPPPPAPTQQPTRPVPPLAPAALPAHPVPPQPAPAHQRPTGHAAPPTAPVPPAPPPGVPQQPPLQQPPVHEPPGQPEQWPAAGEPDPYSTGTLHAAPAGYSPQPERRHPRDPEYSARTGEVPAAGPPAPSQQNEPLADEDPPDRGWPPSRSRPYADPARRQPSPHDEPAASQSSRGAQGSEFFDDIPPRSEPDDDSEFLLGDLIGDAGDGRRASAPDDDDQEYRGRRSRRSS